MPLAFSLAVLPNAQKADAQPQARRKWLFGKHRRLSFRE